MAMKWYVEERYTADDGWFETEPAAGPFETEEEARAFMNNCKAFSKNIESGSHFDGDFDWHYSYRVTELNSERVEARYEYDPDANPGEELLLFEK